MRTFDEVLGQNVRRLRERHGLSQDALAFNMGLHQCEISRLERGKRKMTAFELYLAMSEFGVSAAEILAGLYRPPNRGRS